METKNCIQCDKLFFKKSSHSNKAWQERTKFCSRKCVNESLLGKGIKNAVKFKKGQISFNRQHGLTTTRFYNIWSGMKKRCTKPLCHSYPWYGGKGIKVNNYWEQFTNFLNDMYQSYIDHVKIYGEKQTTLDRLDSSKNYSKENCRWATLKEQGENRRQNRDLNG